MLNQPVNVFLAGANKKLGSVAECLLLSEIYVRGMESSAFVMSRDYVEKALGIKKTSQTNYYNKFIDLGLCEIEIRGNKRIIKPNMKKITKFIDEGSQELLEDLQSNNVSYEVKNKEKEPKKPKQRSILKTTYKSKINYKYMADSSIVKEYKNKRAEGANFTSAHGIFYNLSKLDTAISTDDFSNLTSTDYTIFFKIIYEEFYKTSYPSNKKDMINMKKFINSNKVQPKDIINQFINIIENYEKLGYANDSYPVCNIWTISQDWLVNAILGGQPKYKGVADKKAGIICWDDKIVDKDSHLYAESEEVF